MDSRSRLVLIQYNFQDGGFDRIPAVGSRREPERLDGFISFLRDQQKHAEQNEERLGAVLLQEGKYWLRDGEWVLRRIAAATGLRPFITEVTNYELHVMVWIDPRVMRPVRFQPRAGGLWRLGAAELDVVIDHVPLTLVSAHLHVGSPETRRTEAAELSGALKHGKTVILGGDFNSARATGPAQNMQAIGDPRHRVHRADPHNRDAPDRGAARYLVEAGMVSVHEHIGGQAAREFTAGHRHHQRHETGSHPDHLYVTRDLINGTVGEVNDCQVITEQHYPGIYELSDHLPTRAWLHLGPASQDRPTSGRPS